jgi:acyl-CoA thioesterase-1
MIFFTHTARGARLPAWLLAAFVGITACSAPAREPGDGDGADVRMRESESATVGTPAATPRTARPRIVVLGDSLTAGLGLDPAEAYPAVLQQMVDRAGLQYEVVNAGISGDTSAGGLRRLDWALDGDVKVLIVALGANDGLRGLSTDELAANLSAIVEAAEAKGIEVVLAGMEAPPNFGQDYTAAFRAVYPRVAKQHGVALIPFLLDGVAGVSALNQRDGIHPTAAGARRVAENVWSVLAPAIQ